MESRKTPSEVTFEELAWFAGIIDGEGSIGAYFYADQNSPKYAIHMGNTSKPLVEQYCKILRKIGVEPFISNRCYYRKTTPQQKEMRLTKISRKKDILFVLKTIEPYLVAKKKQARILINFFEKYPKLVGMTRSGKTSPWQSVYEKVVSDMKRAKEAECYACRD